MRRYGCCPTASTAPPLFEGVAVSICTFVLVVKRANCVPGEGVHCKQYCIYNLVKSERLILYVDNITVKQHSVRQLS